MLIFDGNSLTRGGGVTPYPTQTFALLGNRGTFYNFGVDGQTLVQQEADAATQIDAIVNDASLNLVICWGGINDILAGADEATVYGRIVTYCTNRRTAGKKVMILDTIVTNLFNPAMEAIRVALNADLKAHWATFADQFLAASEIPELQDYNDTTYFYDKTHLTTAGCGKLAAAAAPKIAALE